MLLRLLGLPFAFVMSWNAICFLDTLYLFSWRPNKRFFWFNFVDMLSNVFIIEA